MSAGIGSGSPADGDTGRHLAERRRTEFRPRESLPPQLDKTPTLVRRFDLPRQIHWRELRWERRWFYALGTTPGHLTLVRGRWDGVCQSVSWERPAEELKPGLVFAALSEPDPVVALRTDGPPLPLKIFPATNLFASQGCRAGTFPWLPVQGSLLAFGEGLAWSMHLAAGRAVLFCHDRLCGQLLRTLDVTNALFQDAESTEATRFCLTAVRLGAAVAMGNRLVVVLGTGEPRRFELPGQVIRLVPTPANTRPGVAIMLMSGACMHWVGEAGCMDLDRDMHSPLGSFVSGGPLVLVSGPRALLLEVDSKGVHGASRLNLTGQVPIGVCATNEPQQFAVLKAGGEMEVFRVRQ